MRRASRNFIVSLFWAAAFLTAALFSSQPVLAQPPKPFAQCPKIGASPSCAVLYVFNADGSTSVYADTSIGPYDSDEDTLVGVLNNSGRTQTSLTLSGVGKQGLGIFDFDGDGICTSAYLPFPGSSYCSGTYYKSDPGDYAGPITTFSNISTKTVKNDTGTVNFTGGLAPGASTYFALEDQLNSPTVPPPPPVGGGGGGVTLVDGPVFTESGIGTNGCVTTHPASATFFASDPVITVWFTLSGLSAQTPVLSRFSFNGTLQTNLDDGPYSQFSPGLNYSFCPSFIPSPSAAGSWTVTIYVSGQVFRTIPFTVSSGSGTCAPTAGNLIGNGSFELPGNAGSFVPFYANSSTATAIPCWTVTAGSIDYVGTFWQPSNGSYSLDMGGPTGPGTIAQSFSTTAGTSYTVTFDLAGTPTSSPQPKVLQASAGGLSQSFSFDSSNTSVFNMGWVSRSFTFCATSSTSTLAFTSLVSGDDGPALDNVRVVAGAPCGGGGGINLTGTYICTWGPSSSGPMTLTQNGTTVTGTLPNGGTLIGTVTITITITVTGTWTSGSSSGTITLTFTPDGTGVTGTWTRTGGPAVDPGGAPATSPTGTVTGTKTPSGGGGGGTITGITLESGHYASPTFGSAIGIWTASGSSCGAGSGGNWTLGVSQAGDPANRLLNNPDRSVSLSPGNYFLYNAQFNQDNALRVTLCWSDGRPNDQAIFSKGDFTQAAQFTRLSGSTNISLASTGITTAKRVPSGTGLTSDGSANDVLLLGILGGGGGGGGGTCGATGISAGLIGCWQFDGNYLDGSGNGRDLTPRGNVSFGPGISGQALVLPGDPTAYAARSANDSVFDFTSGDFSIQAWFKTASLSGIQSIMAKPSSAGGGSGWYLSIDNGMIDFVSGAGAFVQGSGAAAAAWNQVVVTRQGGTITLYVNGTAKGTVASGTFGSSVNNLYIGVNVAVSGFVQPLSGSLDQIAIWNRALSPGEITQLNGSGGALGGGGGGGGGGNCPASTSSGTGSLTLSRIDVTRNYVSNGQPWNPLPGGAVSPGKISLTPDQRCITSGWNFKWPDANTGPNHNTTSATVALTTVPAGVTPGTSASLAATVNGSWDTTGYGVNRDHTIKLDGVAGTGQSKTALDDPSSIQQTQFTTSNTLTVPPASGGGVTLTLNGTLRFGDDHTVLTQIDLVYGTGGGGGGGTGNPPVTTSPGCSYNVQPADGPGGQPPALPRESAAGNIEFALVFSQPGCKFAAYSPVSWVKVTPTALTNVSVGGQGSTTIQIDPQPAGGAQRQTTLTVADKQVTVIQLASSSSSSCSYTLGSTSSPTFPYNPTPASSLGLVSVTVTGSQCLVQASIDPASSVPAQPQWAQIYTSFTFSTAGTKTIGYQVNYNNFTSARSIKLIITGTNPAQTLTYTINQAAGPANTNPPPTISPGGITNSASNITGGPIALGSFFSIYGSNLGPPNPGVKATSYPLQTTLAGVSLSVSDGKGNTVQALPVFVAQFQINAIMPSNAPLGDVQITATYNGVIGSPQRATVVTSAFGAFAVSLGRGPGIVQNAKPDGTRPLNSAVTTAGPATYVIVWGTGLGPLSLSLSCAGATVPDQCDPNTSFVPQVSSIQVFVGGVQVNLQDQYAYTARAPDIAGVDQVQFPLPANVPLGCYVPVQVVVNGNLYSNTVTMAINTSGQCVDDNPLSRLPRDGGKNGFVLLARLSVTGAKDPTFNGTIDLGIGEFLQQPAGGPLGFDTFAGTPPMGTCTYYNNIDLGGLLGGQLPSVAGSSFLDAGAAIMVQGPNGSQPLIRPDSSSPYLGLLGGALSSNPKPFLDPGAFTVSGAGGKDVGTFSFNMNVGAPATLITQVTTIPRSQPLVLNWSGGSNQNILILGYAQDPDKKSTGAFECVAPANTTTFPVPAGMLANLPTTITSSGNASGALLFLTMPAGNQFVTFNSSSPALDSGVAMYLTGEARLVAFQ